MTTGFEGLMKQVQSMTAATHQLSGQVATMYSGFLSGAFASPAFRSNLILAHIRLLASLLADVPSMEGFDFDILLGSVQDREGKSWYVLVKNTERLKGEIEYLEEVINDIQQAIAEVMAELHQLRNALSQLSQIHSGLNQTSELIDEARDMLEREVIPEIERLLDTLEELLDRYIRELKLRKLHLWRLQTVFRWRVPYMRDIREKRLRRAAERDRLEGERLVNAAEEPLHKIEEEPGEREQGEDALEDEEALHERP